MSALFALAARRIPFPAWAGAAMAQEQSNQAVVAARRVVCLAT